MSQLNASCYLCVKRVLFSSGVATTSRPPEIRGLCCERDLQNRRYSAKEIYKTDDIL